MTAANASTASTVYRCAISRSEEVALFGEPRGRPLPAFPPGCFGAATRMHSYFARSTLAYLVRSADECQGWLQRFGAYWLMAALGDPQRIGSHWGEQEWPALCRAVR